MKQFRPALIFVTSLLMFAPALAKAQESDLVVPPSLRSPGEATAAKPAATVKKAKKPAVASKAANKTQSPAALPLASRQKTDENPIALGMKWKADTGSGGNSAAGSYNPWFYKGDTSGTQVQGGLKFGF
ncbi:hypothetical protein [Methylovirgula sp. 4M-Z18]|uniref:hypothetical protein n=1 Tax=Methylovirgula sp. 4M-Z18 TaxID=2293567 RepID=UPI000E2E8FF7|nr:hypothetical protein [Methylovirgula sp. 4M-Z18]RFB78407.1 hypothetical protein DYH55_16840 [Methylovirgula sp. 4M-Z18]